MLERVTAAEVITAVSSVVKDTDTVVCTDGHTTYERFQDTLGVTTTMHFVASYHGHVRYGGFHVQNVNNYQGRLRSRILHELRGVATKYLAHDLSWMRLMSCKHTGIDAHEIVASAMGRRTFNL